MEQDLPRARTPGQYFVLLDKIRERGVKSVARVKKGKRERRSVLWSLRVPSHTKAKAISHLSPPRHRLTKMHASTVSNELTHVGFKLVGAAASASSMKSIIFIGDY